MSDALALYKIGEAAARSGVSAANIRYYEKENLLRAGVRSESSYRLYSEADIHQLRFIRLCRVMDMSLDEVRTLLALDWHNSDDCAAARTTVNAHLQHVRERLHELQSLERELVTLRDCCDGNSGVCHTIEALHRRADEQAMSVLAASPAKRHV
ncbi:MAG: MerR family transcriptional regulator [Comamonas sp.]